MLEEKLDMVSALEKLLIQEGREDGYKSKSSLSSLRECVWVEAKIRICAYEPGKVSLRVNKKMELCGREEEDSSVDTDGGLARHKVPPRSSLLF